MKRLVEETFSLTAKHAAKALPIAADQGTVEFKIADQYVQQIKLVTTPGNAGGLVYWFLCPGCERRKRKLYLPSGEVVFLCRKCHNLAYRAQQLRAFKKPEKAKEKMSKKRYTKKERLRKVKAYFEKMGRKEKAV
jgi:hypothetical protein